jgi:deoxycytidine triphosphate deaminase
MVLFSPIIIEKNSRLAQLMIHESEESEEYDGNYQGNKDLK